MEDNSIINDPIKGDIKEDNPIKDFLKEYKYEILLGLLIVGSILYSLYNRFSIQSMQSIKDYFISDKIFEGSNIYVTLTTIPERLIHPWFYNNLKHLMNLNGTYKVLLNVPETFNATGEKYIIPENILELQKDNLIINRFKEDYGPITKLFGALLNDDISDDSAILVCDDDIHYYEDFVKLIYQEYKQNKAKVYSYCRPTIEGFKGFMFQKSIMKPILNIKKPESCFRIDDNFIEEFIRTNYIPIQSVSYYGNENKYNDYRKGFCNFDINIHDNHTPRWKELKSDNREPMIKQCKKDYHKLNF